MVQTAQAARAEANGPAAEARRLEILSVASKLFRDKGLHETGMRDIAAELGVTAGSLYYYFPSKQDLLAYCQEATLGQLLGLAREARAGAERADVQLARLIAGHVRVLNEATPGSLAHLEVDAVPAKKRTKLLAQRKRYEQAYRRVIEDGIAAGVFRPLDARLAALALLGALNWTVKWFQADGRKSAEEVGREFADLLVHGLLTTGTLRNGRRAGPPAERSPRGRSAGGGASEDRAAARTAGGSPRPGGRVISARAACGPAKHDASRAGPPAERSPRGRSAGGGPSEDRATARTAGWSPRPGGRVIPASADRGPANHEPRQAANHGERAYEEMA